MPKNLKESLSAELGNLLKNQSDIANEFKKRIEKGKITRDENQLDHFCVFFAAYDSKAKKVFIGNHKKSGLWLFNGGHLDKGETFHQAVKREIEEEWGINVNTLEIKSPELLTTMPINNPKQICKFHFDVWYFININSDSFYPDLKKLAEETHEMRWTNLEYARTITTDKNTLSAYDFIKEKYFNKEQC